MFEVVLYRDKDGRSEITDYLDDLETKSETDKNAPFILDQLEQDFALEDIDVVHVGDWDGKNIAGQLIPVIRQDMTDEDWDVLNERHLEIDSAMDRIFNQYINGEMVE